MPDFMSIGDATLHYALNAGSGSRQIVFINSLGTDFRIWDAVIDGLPKGTAHLRSDKRGHGLSVGPKTDIAGLAADVAGLMDATGFTNATICGVSVGGLIAQSLAMQRPDLVRNLILSNTGLKIGVAADWDARIGLVREGGMEAIADAVLERWFSRGFRANETTRLAGYRAMLTRTWVEGYVGVSEAIRDCDLRGDAARVSQRAICIGGDEDSATPVELVTGLAEGLPDAELRILTGVGHLPCLEAPEAILAALNDLAD